MDRKTLERISALVTGGAVLYFLVPLVRIYGWAGVLGMALALVVVAVALVAWSRHST